AWARTLHMLERGRGEVGICEVVTALDGVDEELGDVVVLLVLHARLDYHGLAFDVADAATVERLYQLVAAVVEARAQRNEIGLAHPRHDLTVARRSVRVERGLHDVHGVFADLL